MCSTFARTYCLGSRVESLPHEDFDVAPLHRCTWWILQRCSKFVLDHSSWILGRLTSDTMDHLSLQPQPKRSCDPAPSISTQALSWTKNKDKLNLVYIKVSWLKKKESKLHHSAWVHTTGSRPTPVTHLHSTNNSTGLWPLSVSVPKSHQSFCSNLCRLLYWHCRNMRAI